MDEFEVHTAILRRTEKIESWKMGMIKPNDKWNDEVQNALSAADLVVMLLSPNFFASDYIWDHEFLNTLERWRRKEVIVAGIVINKCEWRSTPLKDIQLIAKGKVISEAANRDTAWFEAVQDLKRIL